MCCVWEGNTRVADRLALDDVHALGHLIYSMGASGQPVALPDLHLARLGVQRRIEVSVESFLLAPFLLQGTDLVTLVPARAEAFLRRTGRSASSSRRSSSPCSSRCSGGIRARRRDPGARVAARADHTRRGARSPADLAAVRASRAWHCASRTPATPGGRPSVRRSTSSTTSAPRRSPSRSGADDVAAAVRHAAERGLAVAPQRTGHGAAAMGPIDDALLLKTNGLRDVRVDAGRAVGARRRRRAVGRRRRPRLRARPRGTARLLTRRRRRGLHAERRAGLVRPRARSRLEHHDRSGGRPRRRHPRSARTPTTSPICSGRCAEGGGSFGVVTAIEFDLVPVPELHAGTLFFPWERAAEVLHAWHDWTA